MNVQNNVQGLQQVLGPAEVSSGAKNPGVESVDNLSAQTDEAHLSAAGSLISQALALPDIRPDKIASVQTSLANGSYRVNSSDVAARLIDHMQANQD